MIHPPLRIPSSQNPVKKREEILHKYQLEKHLNNKNNNTNNITGNSSPNKISNIRNLPNISAGTRNIDSSTSNTNNSSSNEPTLAQKDLDQMYIQEWKPFHLSQIVSYYRDMRSFPVVGRSTYALLWKRKFVTNPHVTDKLKGLTEQDFVNYVQQLN